MERPLFLSSSNLELQPDLSERDFTHMNFQCNYLYIIREEYLSPTCKMVDFGKNDIHDDGVPIEWPDQIEKILLYSNYLTDLTGIHWPTHLKHLDVYNNPLINLPTVLPQGLEELEIGKTNIQSIETLPSGLKSLSVISSRLYKLPVILPKQIEKLFLAENFLSLRGLPGNWGESLKYLDLAKNKLKSFPRGLPDTLEVLNLNKNEITEIPEELPKNLQQLLIAKNKIRKINTEYRIKPIDLVVLDDNQLTEKIKEPHWAKTVIDSGNWNEEFHQVYAKKIQRAWRRFCIHIRLRAWYKQSVLREELYMVALHPDRILKTDDFSKWHFGC